MAAPDVGRIRQALADAISTAIPNDWQVSPYVLAQPTPPGIQILPPAVLTYDQAMVRGLDEWTFMVQAFVALTTDRGSQVLLDALCSGVMKAALEVDRTLGGLVQSVRVVSQSPGRLATFPGGSPMLLVEWQVQILARGV